LRGESGCGKTLQVPFLEVQVPERTTQSRRAEGISEDYTQVLLADAYGGYNGVVAGNAITRRLLIPCETKVRGSEENGTGDRARGGRADRRTVCGGTTGQRYFR
jgi:hypothetical protein